MLPTPEELVLMPWHKRDKALAQARRLMRAYGLAFEEGGYRRRATAEQRARMVEARKARDAEWGARVREEALRLESEGAFRDAG